MVNILQALKVSILFFFLGLLPLLIALLGLGGFINDGQLSFGSTVLVAPFYIWLIAFGVGFFIFFIGLFKAIGDITEAALIE